MDKQSFGGNSAGRRNRQAVLLKILLDENAPNSSITMRRVMAVVKLKKLWNRLMGARMAQISHPYRLKDGILYVAVREAMWIAELPYMKEDMVKKLTETGLKLTDIRFTLSETKIKTEKRKSVKIPLTEEDREWIDKTAAKIKDTKHREVFKAALIAYKQKNNKTTAF